MGLSFLVPAFFAGAALLAAPWIIHRIRRPEREPVKFSSLLFIPDVTKEVIERRRVQHWLLMLMRMAVLALLAMAFARPYWKSMAAVTTDEGARQHIVLLDTSYSMDGLFDQAKGAARNVINELPAGERAGVITFAKSAALAAPLRSDADASAGTPEAARDAIAAATLTNAATNYVPALELAQQHLLGETDGSGAPRGRYLIHLVTDAQRTGLPDAAGTWKVSPAIELIIIPVGPEARRNYAITDVQVRPAPDGSRRVLGKLRNWTNEDADDVRVRLVLGDREIAARDMPVKARSAIQVAFELPAEAAATALEGYLELDDGGIPVDDRRYFSFSAPPQSNVAIVTNEPEGTMRTPAWFFTQAFPNDAKSPWRVARIAPADLADAIADGARRPAAIVLAGLAGTDAALGAVLRRYVEDGGRVLLALDPAQETTGHAAADALLANTGLTLGDIHRADVGPGQFDLLSWVDFEHPIFVPFQGARTNDFSSVRFFNYQELNVTEPAKAIARFDDNAPAIAEAPVGAGKVIVWPFALRLEWTTLPRSARFVPVLFETLLYLSDHREERVALAVGETLQAGDLTFNEEGRADVWVPGDDAPRSVTGATAGQVRLDAPGLLRLRPAGSAEWAASRPVNVDAREGDVERLPVDEFRARLAAAQALPESTAGGGIVGTDVDAQGYTIDKEYGRAALIAVCLLVLMECLYMTWLSARGQGKRASAAGA